MGLSLKSGGQRKRSHHLILHVIILIWRKWTIMKLILSLGIPTFSMSEAEENLSSQLSQSSSGPIRNSQRNISRSNPVIASSSSNTGHAQRQKAQRASLACERCRIKKLRCTGGHPCSSCQRVNERCDFGDKAADSQQGVLIANQRLAQLEKTVDKLVSGLSHLTQAQQPSPSSSSSSFPSGSFTHPQKSHNNTEFFFSEPPKNNTQTNDIEHPAVNNENSFFAPRTAASDPPTYAPLQSIPRSRAASEELRPSFSRSSSSAGLDSRWSAVQNDLAPFPALMHHPSAWSGRPVASSPEDGHTIQPVIGMAQYKAKVGISSDPVSEGIMDRSTALALYCSFFDHCHPLYPILDHLGDAKNSFQTTQTSSPFLFAVIIAISARFHVRLSSSSPLRVPMITRESSDLLNDLAYSHLGFVSMRKQHRLEDIQATLLLSLWLLRGKGQSPDPWIITGTSIRLAYRIGMHNLLQRPAVGSMINSTQNCATSDMAAIINILPEWHTLLALYCQDVLLSLGFGRPHMTCFSIQDPVQYRNAIRNVKRSHKSDASAAIYMTSLAELTIIAAAFIHSVQQARLTSMSQDNSGSSASASDTDVTNLLISLNTQLDAWDNRWTWSGSLDAIGLGKYKRLAKIFGAHVRLCVNSTPLTLLANTTSLLGLDSVLWQSLTRACEAAVTLVQIYADSSGENQIVLYGFDYIILILAQAAAFLVRVSVTRLPQPLPIELPVLLHYLKSAVEILQNNDISTTHICGHLARLLRDLARTAGLALNEEEASDTADHGLAIIDHGSNDSILDFDLNSILGFPFAAPGDVSDIDPAHYFDFSFPLFNPPMAETENHEHSSFSELSHPYPP
ncbi:uncharacterized protein L201_004863 [Kwoniella dendrophila CBS 6074]|uniref:Zn(2)-C6 fungal-type domain-containing protein n=1 Tax=Kwoniella dendrophila CBS 6074 TaxID=1295534 RepID=A0AAX4JYK4_9TREE